MQLLRMALQRDQEADSNANHVSHASHLQGLASHSSADHSDLPVSQSPPSDGNASTAPFFVLLQAPSSDLPQTSSSDQGSVSVSSPIPSDRQELNSSVILTPVSSVFCSHESCHTDSSTVDSESSPSPDVNCNILTPCLKIVHPVCAKDASPDVLQKINTEVHGPERKRPLLSPIMTSTGQNRYDMLETSTEDKTDAEHRVSESSRMTSTNGRAFPVFEATSQRRKINDKVFTHENRGTLYQSLEQVGDLHSQPEHNDLQPPGMTAANANDSRTKHDRFRFTSYHGLETLRADSNLRNSVDMDVDDIENEEPDRLCGSKSFAPYIPQSTGLAGQDQPVSSDALYNIQSVKVNPVSVIVKPPVLSPSFLTNLQNINEQVNPPIWTALALRSAVRDSRLQTSSGVGQVSATANVHTQCISESLLSEETEAVVKNLNQKMALCPKRVKADGPCRRTSLFKNHNHNVSPASRARLSASPPKRSALHGTLRQRSGRTALSCALKSGDLFMEALLEDECALYAGRLQSFFRDLTSVCDGHHPPDPVARILSEGDDMHFVPICDDPGTNGC